MIYQLIHYLHGTLGLKVPAVLTYTSTRMMLAALTSWLICILMGPRLIKKLYELKIGQSIRTDECPLLGELHAKKQNTPTMGGVLILFSMMVSMVLWMDLSSSFSLILLFTSFGLGGLGAIDDYLKIKRKNAKGLSAKKKLVAQLLISGLIATYLFYPPFTEFIHTGHWFAPPVAKDLASGGTVLSLQEYSSRIYLPFFKEPVLSLHGAFIVLAILLAILVVTGSSNAVNLTDGLDGLASGCLIMVAICLGLIAFVSNNVDLARYLNILYIEGSGEIAIYLSAFAGACLGFLWYNTHPAQIFMGDTGSLALGGVIGVCAVLLKREFLLAIVGGIFVVEALSVILQVGSYRLRNKKRIFLCAPLHHHFEYKGWHETKVVVRFWIVGLILTIIGIA
ncbi:MAG: Phospho-N-acetylmuramoyl-pentapeptide-transferase, partial [Chlamydiae bacterium]|nr:Phospho-N-acetylmuramoyl-pentapeptide-transferase [Chlamydiota bacterium]